MIELPADMFLAGSDLSPLEDNIDTLLAGLTEWKPEHEGLGMTEWNMLEIKGSDYLAAQTLVNNTFSRNGWGDGLWITPPTEELVDWIMTGTDKAPDDVIGVVTPHGGIADVRHIAVCLAMAGGRPEYLPFLIAAVAAMTNTKNGLQSWNTTTNSVFPVFVVNGPASADARISHGYGLLGPKATHPAGGILGRAIRLILLNLGGAVPGVTTMAIFGGMRHVNAFFAEDEEGIPSGWKSYAEERGFDRNQNVVTVTLAGSMSNIFWEYGDKETNEHILHAMGGMMSEPVEIQYTHPERAWSDEGHTIPNPDYNTGVVLLPRDFCRAVAEENGYSKDDVKRVLWENSKMPYEKAVDWGILRKVQKMYPDVKPGDMIPVSPNPDQLTIVIAGGEVSAHGYYMHPVVMGDEVSVEVELPSNWDDLLLDAAIDLGSPAALD